MELNTKKKKTSYLWTELFRPQKVADIVMPAQYKKAFNKYIKEGQIPNLLLYSSKPGVGKTSLAKALVNELEADYLYINASKTSGIDLLRDRITKFASSKSFNGKPKVVIMDEADGTSPALQQGLRAFTEEFARVCRFIFTCNYVTKIIEPLKSRLHEYDMNYSTTKDKKEMMPKIKKRIIGILKLKKIEYKEDVIEKLIVTSYPDIRKVIQLCHKYSDLYGVIDNDIFGYETVDKEFYEHVIQKNFGKARKYVLDKAYDYDELYSKMYREYVPLLDTIQQGQAILIIAEWAKSNAWMADKELNFAGMLIELMQMG